MTRDTARRVVVVGRRERDSTRLTRSVASVVAIATHRATTTRRDGFVSMRMRMKKRKIRTTTTTTTRDGATTTTTRITRDARSDLAR